MQITINPLVFSFFFACPTVKNSRAWTSELVRGKKRSWLRHCLRGSERVLQGGQEQASRPPPTPPSAPSNDPEGGGKAASRSHACQHAHAQSCSPAAERGGNPIHLLTQRELLRHSQAGTWGWEERKLFTNRERSSG